LCVRREHRPRFFVARRKLAERNGQRDHRTRERRPITP
jgi:hypothetical protein